MRKQSGIEKHVARLHNSHLLAGLLSACLLVLVGLVDYLSGKEVSFTLFYLLPVSTAVWFVGRRFGLVMCAIAAVTGLTLELLDNQSSIAAFWNAGMRFGVYLVLCGLLDYIKSH